MQFRRPFDPWVGKIPWRRAWQPTPVFLPGESPWTRWERSMAGNSPQRVRHGWATKHSTAQVHTIQTSQLCYHSSYGVLLKRVLIKKPILLFSPFYLDVEGLGPLSSELQRNWNHKYTFKSFHILNILPYFKGFPDSSVGKEPACNAEDPSSIPGSGRFTGEGIGYPLQYSWASLVAQMVKNPPAMQETWVQSLGWEDLLEKGKATHSSILAWRIPWIR